MVKVKIIATDDIIAFGEQIESFLNSKERITIISLNIVTSRESQYTDGLKFDNAWFNFICIYDNSMLQPIKGGR